MSLIETMNIISLIICLAMASLPPVVDKDSDHYRLDAFADEYERRYDCNDAENDIWAEIITTFLEEQAQTSAISMTGRVV